MANLPSGERSFASLNILVVSPTPTHPQDHGNRKRIFEICAELKRRGARVEFVHYPGEHDWRRQWPRRHEANMRAAWDDYYLVAPTRELHEYANSEDHEIDEWADPALKAFVGWACRRRAYDAVIVNYTWMSFCLEAIPPGVFKICDTHDVFGGRRQLLEANGIAPEFFHTTAAEEARGLKRADLVWAIKPSEESYFRDQLGLPQCLTMLHAEPEREFWRGPPSADGWLRVGVIGAKNSINKRNFEAFLSEALPVIEAYMAPVKILLAGGLSDEFGAWSHPNLEVVGRVEDVGDFYRSVDVVAAPIRFSTGLKIKVSEALASGAPLVAHAHAMEGYPTREPLHRLHSFADMGLELARLAFDRTPLPALAQRSRAVCRAVRASVLASLDETHRLMLASMAATICFVVPAEAFDPLNLLHDHLLEALDYLRHMAPVAIFAAGEAPPRLNFEFLQRYDLRPQIFVDPELARSAGERAPEFWTAITLADLMEARAYSRVYLMKDCGDDLLLASTGWRQAIVRWDAILIAGGDADGLIENLRPATELIVVSGDEAALTRWRETRNVAVVVAPFRRNWAFESLGYRRKGAAPAPLLVLASPDDPVGEEVMRLAARLDWPAAALDPGDPAVRAALLAPDAAGADPLTRFSDLRLLVDLTENDPMADILGEAAIRAGVPRLVLQRGDKAIGRHAFATPFKPTSAARLFTTVADCAISPGVLEKLRRLAMDEATYRYKNDAGWALLWGALKSEEHASNHRTNS